MFLIDPQGPYTDPATGLRYHDKSIYELIKGLVGDFDFVRFRLQLIVSAECYCSKRLFGSQGCKSHSPMSIALRCEPWEECVRLQIKGFDACRGGDARCAAWSFRLSRSFP